ncbi:MAG: dihydrolipoyl dehydrogenase [Alphaproteobacteria bacterium]|nr:dihydrolipoyl dehydrogenase [Alphaproteobacteria bacterium]OJV46805.1 MAG: dihydrolipoyl dehydrogenase [Alphaproteobacteria bacterium 43-37]
MTQKVFDLIVIGGGPGGYVAAIKASQLGLNVALIEKQHLGGICLNWGCIPTKALLRVSEIYRTLGHLQDFGLSVEKPTFDLKKIVARSRQVADQLSKGISHLLKKNKVTLIEGTAKIGTLLAGVRSIEVIGKSGEKSSVQAKNAILATGARPRQLPGLEADGKFVWTSKEAMIPEDLPKKLLVIGSGAIGIEFASFYSAFGVETIVVELQDRILPNEDAEISALAIKSFEKQGIQFMTKSSVIKLNKQSNQVEVIIKTADGEKKIMVDRIISAVGIIGNTEDLGLENTKVKVDRGHITTREFGQTNEPGLFAIGDVTAGPWLAHKASHEGVHCAEFIAGKKPAHGMKTSNIPGCTYSFPQIASVGLTEKQALDAGHKVKVGRFPFLANGKAIALGEPEGLVKTIFDEKTGELLGAHMIGAEVTEMIQGYCIAKTMEATEVDLMCTIFPHPTLSEMMHESVLDAYGKAIHF